jgi:hypothetical protein
MRVVAIVRDMYPIPSGVRYDLFATVEDGTLTTSVACDITDLDMTEANIRAKWKEAVAAKVGEAAAQCGMDIKVNHADVRIP